MVLKSHQLHAVADEATSAVGAVTKQMLALSDSYEALNEFIRAGHGKARIRVGSTWYTVSRFSIAGDGMIDATIEALGVIDDSIVIRFRHGVIQIAIYPCAENNDFVL